MRDVTVAASREGIFLSWGNETTQVDYQRVMVTATDLRSRDKQQHQQQQYLTTKAKGLHISSDELSNVGTVELTIVVLSALEMEPPVIVNLHLEQGVDEGILTQRENVCVQD